jgi:hypothetical protein
MLESFHLLSTRSLPFSFGHYWIGRFILYRGLFLTYFLAFLVAFRQFCPLAGENGLMPFTRWLEGKNFWEHPTLLHFFDTDRAVKVFSLIGLVLSGVGLLGIEWLGTIAVGSCLLTLWLLYLSIVKAGGLFYGFGWESFLLETGFLSIFLGGAYTTVSPILLLLIAWLLFRVMFGAGLIKVRGDECWRDLTCMDYHYETQPMPNPSSWFVHHLPRWWHKLEVLGNHVTELIVPFLYVLPQPLAGAGAVMTIGFQGWLMVTGNFSWLNFLTAVIAFPLIPDYFYEFMLLVPLKPAELTKPDLVHQVLIYVYASVVLILSYWPAKNLFSSRQVMNAGFDPFSLVNTYGAFGSITKTRYELVVQGREEGGDWKTFEFKGKPTDPGRMPPQWAPYHLRLDWQMWFAAMRNRPRYWLMPMLSKLMSQDEEFLKLIHKNPFDDEKSPDQVRVLRYRYSYTDPAEWWNEGRWWNRKFVEELIPPKRRNDLDRQLR